MTRSNDLDRLAQLKNWPNALPKSRMQRAETFLHQIFHLNGHGRRQLSTAFDDAVYGKIALQIGCGLVSVKEPIPHPVLS
jgi:hypothetical protein